MADDPTTITAIARLYYLDGLGQTEIGEMYGVSRSTVSRMLTTARERGIVQISVDAFDPRDREREARLIEAFGLERVIVIRAGAMPASAMRRAVGYYAAPFVSEWLADARRIGVTGGRTLGEVIRSLAPMPDSAGCEVVQLMGTVAGSPGQNEGSEICRTLARRMYGSFHTLNTPALFADAGMRESIASHAQIRHVLGMAGQVDLAFVGVGSETDSMFIEHGIHPKDEIAALRAEGAVAEICGRYLGRDGAEVSASMADRVISLSLAELRRLPHVVAVTSGEGRGTAVCAVLEAGIVNGLIVDEACASAVLAAHGSRGPGGLRV